ncbi:MAG: hypothetical protein IKA23_09845 [Akkermansia sp.]|nr:hypothetical protein [Akkermansia sp.]MBR2314755.1 hypothetical protein [Akkermansia sp.]
MKRLNFIYCISPLTVALNTIPGMLSDSVLRMIVTAVLALTVWGLIWVRLYGTGKLRPEFAVLSVVPALSYQLILTAGGPYMAVFNTLGWQNFNFLLWLGSIFVYIRAFLPSKDEYRGRLAGDAVFIFMTTVTIIYSLSCWAATHAVLS